MRSTCCITTLGRTASGKTLLARHLAAALGAVYISEAEKKRELRPEYSFRDSLDEGLRDAGYKVAIAAARAQLSLKRTCVIDASFHRGFRRSWLFSALSDLAIFHLLLYTRCPSIAKTRRRIAERRKQARTVATQADRIEVFHHIDSQFEEPTLAEFAQLSNPVTVLVFDTDQNEHVDTLVSPLASPGDTITLHILDLIRPYLASCKQLGT